MKKFKEMNGNEKIAYRNTKYAIQDIVGGYENSISDGYMEEMPTYEDLEDEVYYATTTGTYGEGFASCHPIKEVNFAGEKFIREVIRYFFEKEGFQYPVKHREETTQPEQVTEEATETVAVGDKVYWSVVRCKTNINAQPFVLMMVTARSKKHAEDVIFNTNLAPYGNKIFTKEQILNVSLEWLNKVGIQSKEELERLINDAEKGTVTV